MNDEAEEDDTNCAYGHFVGGDPRKFFPDDEMCSQSEIDSHRDACERWNAAERRGETPTPGPCPSGWAKDPDGNVKHVLKAPYGIGMQLQ